MPTSVRIVCAMLLTIAGNQLYIIIHKAGISLGSEEPPRQRKVHKKVLECAKRSTITVCLINDALDTVRPEQVFQSNQLGHACSIQLYKERFTFCMQRTYPLNCLATALIHVCTTIIN